MLGYTQLSGAPPDNSSMPRHARQTPQGMIVHIISRFVNRAYRLDSDEMRDAYLRRVAAVAPRTDWILLGYALMSTHIHLAAVAGKEPLWRWVKPLHTGFALHLNRVQDTLGPVFANRPTTVAMWPEECGRLLSYIHNNPVRAGVARETLESTWTSHGAYAGQTPARPWLAVEMGLALSGFDADAAGRQQFHEFVAARAHLGRDPQLCGDALNQARVRVRAALDSPVELSSMVLDGENRTRSEILASPGTPIRQRWDGRIESLLRAVARHTGISVSRLVSRERRREVVAARRLAVMTGTRHLGLNTSEVGAALGVSRQAASWLLNSIPPEDDVIAQAARGVAAGLLGDVAEGRV